MSLHFRLERAHDKLEQTPIFAICPWDNREQIHDATYQSRRDRSQFALTTARCVLAKVYLFSNPFSTFELTSPLDDKWLFLFHFFQASIMCSRQLNVMQVCSFFKNKIAPSYPFL